MDPAAPESYEQLRARLTADPENADLLRRAADAARAAGLRWDCVMHLAQMYRKTRAPELYAEVSALCESHELPMLRLPAPRATMPYRTAVWGAFRFGVQRTNLWICIGGGVFFGLLRLLPILFGIFAEPMYLILTAACISTLAMQALRQAARGLDHDLDWSGDDLFSATQLLRVAGYMVYFAPMFLLGAVIVTAYTGVNLLGPVLVFVGLALSVSLLIVPLVPAVLLVWSVGGGSFFERINPVRWFQLASRLPGDYALATLLFFGCGMGMVLAESAARASRALSFVASPAMSTLQVYFVLVSFRALGLVWYHNEEKLAG